MIASWSIQSADTELIVVDDNSTDATAAIVAQRANTTPGLRLLTLADHKGQRGKVAAFNLGVSAAKGDFIGLFGGDDVMPKGSVSAWVTAVDARRSSERAVAFGKLRTISDNPNHKDLVLPRGPRGNRSGGTSLFSRGLAELVFPIPSELPSEDIWTSFLLQALADVVIEVDEVILAYRIHEGNSNPRGMPFDAMSTRIADRARAYQQIRRRMSHLLDPSAKARVEQSIELEAARQTGSPRAVLGVRGISLKHRMRTLSMTTPSLWAVRQRFFRVFSGW